MRPETQALLKKMHQKLVDAPKSHNDGYTTAEDLCRYCMISRTKMYAMMRRLREMGIGIYSRTGKGYILAQCADQTDDVNALRKIHGRRTSDMISLNASLPFMRERWTSEWEKKELDFALKPLIADQKALERSEQVLLDYHVNRS